MDLVVGVVVVELGLERLAVDDPVKDAEGEGRVARDLGTGHTTGLGDSAEWRRGRRNESESVSYGSDELV